MIPVLYEDNHVLVVEKPVNLPVQADSSGDPDLLTLLKADLKARHKKPGNVYLGLVHRLDRPAGGVMVFAKTSKAASRLAAAFRDDKVKKIYRAVVHGKPQPPRATLEDWLLKDETTNIVRVVSADAPDAKRAILHYRLLQTKGELSLVEVDLQTGRPHQIRVQLAARGWPLFGDQKYGADRNKPGQQLALWSVELRFPHPVKDEIMECRSAPPADHPWTLFQTK